jgi:hypothetical protein
VKSERKPRLSKYRRIILNLAARVLLVRAGWLALAILTLIVFIVSIGVHFRHQVHTFPVTGVEALQRFGLSLKLYVGYTIALDVLTMLVFSFTAVAIFRRKSNDRMALLVSTTLLTFGAAIAPSLNTLQITHPGWRLPVLLVRNTGFWSLLLVFFLFPDGKFVPRWTRTLSFIWIGWLLAWSLFPPVTFDPNTLPLPLRFLAFLGSSYVSVAKKTYHRLRGISFWIIMGGWFDTGVFAQVYRYLRVSGPVERQQTKWVMFGLIAAVVGFLGFRIPPSLFPELQRHGSHWLLYHLIADPVAAFLLLLMPLSIGASLLRYRLWDIDPIIERTMVYSTLTGSLAVLYFGGVFVFQRIFRAITGQQSDVAIILSTLAIAALFRPLRRRLQEFIDRRFYRERVDFRQAFTNFSREIRTIIELPKLLRVLVERTTDLLHITHGAVYLRDSRGGFQRTESLDHSPHAPQIEAAHQPSRLPLGAVDVGQLSDGRTVPLGKGDTFSLLVPLLAPRGESTSLTGVLALGPRLSGLGYSREDRTLLTGLADQAGTAIHVARVIKEQQDEARRRREAERQLEDYRNSPAGRAEAFSKSLLSDPEAALIELHSLAQAAGHDPDAASLLDNLSAVLENVGAKPIAKLTEGFGYLVTGQFEPEVLPVGLRIIISQLEAQLEKQESHNWQHASDGLIVYQLCQSALNAGSINQIMRLLEPLERIGELEERGPFRELAHSLSGLHSVAEALHAHERVDTSQDKLSYLASAVERLRRVDYQARTDLDSADRPVMRRIAESWLTVVTGAISELQARAHIVCQLLTRHTWQDDVVSLALKLRNEGRGAAVNLYINLAPAPEYTAMEDAAQVARLAPGEETRVELRVRPRLSEGADQFRARFIIRYTDPRGPDQVEHFADVVRLLSIEGEFQFIPNPYVVGTPLDAGSPLFFGREDVIAFVQQNLTARHQNNLVLIGQRRTGKTSLLKQLTVRLGDDYLPVYLDGQALGLDPGLPNFFLALATEITFALEDRGFELELPMYEDFVESPAGFFEHKFLARVRERLGDRHLLIMFDEFEELEAAVERGNLEASIFGFLRHLIQHVEGLSVIFCGTHRLEELASDYWSVLFNISLYRHIAFLEKPEAMRLTQKPVAEYGMRYDDLALDKIWQVTAGHPYFMQLLCHSLVNRHNRTERTYVTVADVNAALDEILASGEAHFVYLWAEAAPEDRLVLAALSRMIPLTGRATLVQVLDYLAERGVELERQVVSDALHRLTLRDVLKEAGEADPTIGAGYRWRLGLLGLWVERYKSMSRVIEEVRGA